ncbi:hypothetical protein C0Z17_01710 [Trinickia caryophylli]|nr:hypothetical protein C0Z17_01710 [Trinickia caryophylli]
MGLSCDNARRRREIVDLRSVFTMIAKKIKSTEANTNISLARRWIVVSSIGLTHPIWAEDRLFLGRCPY